MSSNSNNNVSNNCPSHSLHQHSLHQSRSKVCAAGEASDLIFPRGLTLPVNETLANVLAGFSFEIAQDLLDELSGRMKIVHVRNPARYLVGMKREFLAGNFVLELGAQIKADRKTLGDRDADAAQKESDFQKELHSMNAEKTKHVETIIGSISNADPRNINSSKSIETLRKILGYRKVGLEGKLDIS